MKNSNKNKISAKELITRAGPGIVTGAADDDPSGIATYSQTGAQFGYGQLWTAVFMLPFLIAVQGACARIGAVTGGGLATIIKKRFGKKILYPIVFLLFIANTINIGADIGAMAAATRLIVPVNFIVLTLLFTIIILILEIFVDYKVYSRILKWLSLFLVAYPISVFITHQPWLTVFKATFIPHIQLTFQYLFIILAVFGTTITPYLFFWQVSQVVEEARAKKILKKRPKLHTNDKFVRFVHWDNLIGMSFSEVTTWSIIVVCATTLHAQGITQINTAADAAKALEPLLHTFPHAGFIAKIIFSVGIIGLGFLAVPVLAGSAAYAIGELSNWQGGLSLKLKRAPAFYGVIILATLIGLLVNFVGIDPFRALIYASVINGVVAAPLLLLIAIIARSKKIMGKYRIQIFTAILIWIAFLVMSLAAIMLFYTFNK